MPYTLNTNILLAYTRRSLLYTWMEDRYRLTATAETPLISIVSHGEIRALALRMAWGAAKQQRMEERLSQFIAVPCPF